MSQSWSIPVNNAADGFLSILARILPPGITLCFEHAFPDSRALGLYDRYKSPNRYEPARDTISPETLLFYCSLNADFARELETMAKECEPSDLFWHIKGYDEERLILWLHDAYAETECYLSPLLSHELVQAIAAACNTTPEEVQFEFDWGRIRRIEH